MFKIRTQDPIAKALAIRSIIVLGIFGLPAAIVVYYVKVHNPEAGWLAFVSFFFSWIIFILYYLYLPHEPSKIRGDSDISSDTSK